MNLKTFLLYVVKFFRIYLRLLRPPICNSILTATSPGRGSSTSTPHNPLESVIRADVFRYCIRSCQKYDIHLASDEFFGLSDFESLDLPDALKFTSVYKF